MRSCDRITIRQKALAAEFVANSNLADLLIVSDGLIPQEIIFVLMTEVKVLVFLHPKKM